MVSSKRALSDDEAEEEGEGGEESSSPAQKRMRRPAKGKERVNDQMEDHDMGGQEGEEEEEAAGTGAEDEEGEEKDDESGSDDDEDGWDDSFSHEHEREADYGILTKVVVKNFMCHRCLEVDFGPNMNFVTGCNGSGKSAVLTAIMLGLGARVTTTNRATQLRDVIMKGKEQALIEITLRNKGREAFKPEEYGESITIVREIGLRSSSFKTLNGNTGKVVSRNKDAVLGIVDYFGIQVENPVAVLTQDTAREFLRNSTPEDKYRFFMKATNLDTMIDDLQVISSRCQTIQQLVEDKEAGLPDMLREVEKWEQLFKECQAVQDARERIVRLQAKHVWAAFRDKEAGKLQMEADLATLRAKEAQHASKRDACLAKVAAGMEKNKEAERRCDELEKASAEVEAAYKAKQAEFTVSDKARKRLSKAEKELQRAFENAKQEVESARAEIERLLEEQRRQDGDERAALEAERARYDGQLREAGETKLHFEQQAEELKRVVQGLAERKEACKVEKAELADEHTRHVRHERELKEQQANALTKWGEYVPELRRALHAESARFQRAPVGPIGATLSLDKSTRGWATAVEECIGPALRSWIVSSAADRVAFQAVVNKVFAKNRWHKGQMPRVYTVPHMDAARYATPALPLGGHPTILDVLTCSEPCVLNLLVDCFRIEATVLVREDAEARRFMFSRNAPPPAGLHACFTAEGSKLLAGAAHRNYAASRDTRRGLLLGSSNAEALQQVHNDLAEVATRAHAVDARVSEVDADLKRRTRELLALRNEAKAQDEAAMRLMEQLRAVDDKLAEERVLPDLEEKEQTARTLENEVVEQHARLDELRGELETVQRECAALREQADELNQKHELRVGMANTEVERLNELVDQMQRAEEQAAKADRALEQLSVRVESLEQEVARKAESLATREAQLTADFGERVTTREKVKAIASEIEGVQGLIAREEKRTGVDTDKITRCYHDTKKQYEAMLRTINSYRALIRQLDDILVSRKKAHKNFSRLLGLRTHYNFMDLLSARNHVGVIRIDHARKTLELELTMEGMKTGVDADTANKSKDGKSLSGGERSFSTLSFIVALWEAMSVPFRCLDEFDVFMDMINRTSSMRMLIEISKMQFNRQFILITPQSMSGIQSTRECRITKLRPPDRDQPTLDAFLSK